MRGFVVGCALLFAACDGGNAPNPSWAPVGVPAAATLHGVWGIGPGDVIIVGESGTILRTTDDGRSWSRSPNSTSVYLFAAWASAADDLFAVGDQGVIVHSADGGATWPRWTGEKRPVVDGAKPASRFASETV